MLRGVKREDSPSDDDVIDVGPRRRRHWRRWVLAGLVVLLIVLSRSLAIYISALWFGSLGYSAVYWYVFKLKVAIFFIFAIATAGVLRGAFWLLERTFAGFTFEKRTILINNQSVQFSPGRFLRPASWIVALLFGVASGFSMKGEWKEFGLYLNQPATAMPDPVFGRPLGFYLFSLPIYDTLSSWIVSLTFIILCATLLFSLLALPQKVLKTARPSGTPLSAISIALALFLVCLSSQAYLARFPYLWEDHPSFSGVNYTEAHYLIPAFFIVAIALILAAGLSLLNAFTFRQVRILLIALALPFVVYFLGVIIVPAYITSFIVKPNELDRETPYIEQNIGWTRRAFGLEQAEAKKFEAEGSVEALDLKANRSTVDNIRLWDWQALHDTLKQVQAIRTYYDFSDVDVDRYMLGGQVQQMMIAPREIFVDRLPDQSRNWINEKLIYTHGYGITMNTANGFTPEGLPRFVVSDMPIKATAPEIQVKRPQIYYGQEASQNVYVKTHQQEFDYPQGESSNAYTTFEGSSGIRIGGTIRRMLLAWALGDLSKLPFSDVVTADTRVLLNRNIHKMVNGVAPFLTYDDDPYIVVTSDGRLVWMIDAFTQSTNYPYSRHHQVGNNEVNYIRNSVKVTIDAYDGTLHFYIFDSQDPLITAYKAMFPTLFKAASEMPADLAAHVRYPETLLKAQSEVYSLYHTQNIKAFFQREDVWSIAQRVRVDGTKKVNEGIDPYYVLMQLPGESAGNEFVIFVPFTPSNRNNMIGWMAGRCDRENYGKLRVYDFPESRLIDGPLQIEARIDQNAQLSAQFTLWNTQGSRVLRGHLLVIPVGRSLLYVEPIYLQAESSPMPELRLVVLATQEKLAFGQGFDEAMVNLFGEAAKQPGTQERQPGESAPSTGEQPKATPSPTGNESISVLVNRAIQEFEEYQRLTAQGKLAEAGQKLEQHKRTLEEIRKASGNR
jgi:uncharacterized membrane protein (UPF0182 family)